VLASRGLLLYNLGVKEFLKRIRQCYRYPAILLRAMVVSDFKLRHQTPLLGYLWTVLKPLALFAILFVVFAKFLKFGAGTPFHPIYLLLGIGMWGCCTEMTQRGLNSIVDRAILLEGGRIVAEGTADEVAERYMEVVAPRSGS
jgi:ABC-2 type transport system permease protein